MSRSRALLGLFVVATIALSWVGCGGSSESPPADPAADTGEVVEPPFAVRGDASGLLLMWFDEEGVHQASSRAAVPEARRGEVRVDSLSLPPDARDPDHVFVADLRNADAEGDYTVRRMRREAFDRRVESYGEPAGGEGSASTGAASSDVIVFGASWCGACRQTEAFLRERGIAFVERDIEQDPGARQDMMQRARAAGVSPSGIPVIDFRGRIIEGFDRDALERAIRETGAGGAGAGRITI